MVTSLRQDREEQVLIGVFTSATSMEGNMFWNTFAMSLMCTSSCPKLFRTSCMERSYVCECVRERERECVCVWKRERAHIKRDKGREQTSGGVLNSRLENLGRRWELMMSLAREYCDKEQGENVCARKWTCFSWVKRSQWKENLQKKSQDRDLYTHIFHVECQCRASRETNYFLQNSRLIKHKLWIKQKHPTFSFA